MARLRSNFQRGSLSANIGSSDTTLTSNEFTTLPVVASPDYLMIVLDPDAAHGNPEIVKVTTHTAAASTVSVARAQESTTARAHNGSTTWRHVPTTTDWARVDPDATNMPGAVDTGTGPSLQAIQRIVVGPEKLNILDDRCGGKADSGITDNGAAINAAIALCPTDGGRIYIPRSSPGYFGCSTPIDLHGKHSIIIEGESGTSGGANGAASLVYSGSAARFIDRRSSQGIVLRDLFIGGNNSWSGILIDDDGALSTDTYKSIVDRCTLNAGTNATTLNWNKANNCVVRDCLLTGHSFGVKGAQSTATYSNGNKVDGCEFANVKPGGWHIQGLGGAWRIDGNVFEFNNGTAAAINDTTGIATGRGVVIAANWFGDIGGAGGGILMALRGATYEVVGNQISGDSSSYAIDCRDAPAIKISGNTFDTFSVGVLVNINTYTICEPNSYAAVTTSLSGTPKAKSRVEGTAY